MSKYITANKMYFMQKNITVNVKSINFHADIVHFFYTICITENDRWQ